MPRRLGLLIATFTVLLVMAVPATSALAAPDLTISASHAPDQTLHTPCCTFLKSPQATNDTKYPGVITLNVSNVGTTQTSGTVTVVDALPTGITGNINMVAFNAGPVAAQGTGWTCSGTNTLTCTRADALGPTASYPPITITVITSPTVAASVNNSPTVSGGGDGNSANNSTTDPIATTVDDCPNGWSPEQEITISPPWGPGLHGGLHTGIINPTKADGCTFLDEMWQGEPFASHDAFVSHVQSVTAEYVLANLMTSDQATTIINTAQASQVGTSDDHTVNNECNNRVAITFDDGPSQYRSQTEQTSRDKQVHFTFQDLANRAQANPQFETFAIRDGDTLLQHTVTHPMLPNLSDQDIMDEVNYADQIFNSIGAPLSFLGIRQPSSDATGHTSAIVTQMGYTYVTSPPRINVNDYEPTREPQVTAAGILGMVHPGVIIGMHDGAVDTRNGPNTVAATRLIIDSLRSMGYCFGMYDHTAQVVADRYVPSPDPVPHVINPVPYKQQAAGAGFDFPGTPPAPYVFYPQPLQMTATHSPATFVEGGTGQIQLTLSDVSDYTGLTSVARNTSTVSVVDAIPAGLTATSASGPGWTCTGTGTRTCTRADPLPALSSWPPITINVNVTGTAAPTVKNQPNLTGHGGTWQYAVTDPIGVTQKPQWAITQTAEGLNPPDGPFHQGDQNGVIDIHVQQTSATASTDGSPITAVVTVPAASAGVSPLGTAPVSVTGAGWNCTLGTPANGATCTRSDQRSGQMELPPIKEIVNVYNPFATACTATCPTSSGNNTVTITGGGSAAGTITNNQAFTIAGAPDLTVGSSHSGAFAQGDSHDTYTLTVTNSATTTGSVSGGSTRPGTPVTIKDALPPGLDVVQMGGNGWSCDLDSVACTRSGDDSIAPGGTYPPITLTVSVARNASSPVSNAVSVSSGSGGELNAANDSSTDATAVTSEPDLTPSSVQTGTFTQGDGPGANDSYAITVYNDGWAPTSGTATVTDDLPSGLTPVSMAGSGWSCNIQTATCTSSATVATGAAYPPITLGVTVAPNAPVESALNKVHVSGAGEVYTANDSLEQQTTITQLPDMIVGVTHAGTFTQGDIGRTYSILVSNVSDVPTQGVVTMHDSVPAGLTVTAASGDGWTCTLSVTCTRADPLTIPQQAAPDLPVLSGPWSYPPITVTVNVSKTAAATVTNTATVSGGGEIYTANDSASDVTPITQLAPVACPGSGQTPGVTASTPQATAVTVTLNCTGAGVTYAVAVQPSNGALSAISGNQVTYTPVASFVGDDQFTVRASGTTGGSKLLLVKVTVTAQQGHIARVAAVRITRSAGVHADRVTLSGRVVAPRGISRAQACTGVVAVTVARGASHSSMKVAVKRDCSYRAVVRATGMRGSVVAKIRFLGNRRLKAKAARPITVRLR